MNKFQTFMIVFFILLQRIGNVLTEVQNPLDQNQVNQLKKYRDKEGQQNGYYEQEYLDMIIQDENPSWLCSQVKQINKHKNFTFKHYFNIQMNKQYELYFSRLGEFNLKSKKQNFFSKFLKIENFETHKTTKVLRELNYSFQMSSNPYFLNLNKCYYEQRKATQEHVQKYKQLKIGDNIGERIYMIFDKFDLNCYEFLTTQRTNHKNNNLIELQMIELIKNIAIAIRELHKNGLVHTNLSLSNIGLQKRIKNKGYIPKVYNLDWSSQEGQQEYNSEMGLNIYKAPEFIKGEQNNNKSVDVFALGFIFYALMSKRQIRQFVSSSNNYYDKKIYMEEKFLSKHKELFAIFKWMIDEDFTKRPNMVQVKLELIRYRDCFKNYIADLKKSKQAKKKCDFKYKNFWQSYGTTTEQKNQQIDENEKTLMNLADMIFLKQYLIDSNMNVDRKSEQSVENVPLTNQSIDYIIKQKLLGKFQNNSKDQYKQKWSKLAENSKKQRIKLLDQMKKQLDKKKQNKNIQNFLHQLFSNLQENLDQKSQTKKFIIQSN